MKGMSAILEDDAAIDVLLSANRPKKPGSLSSQRFSPSSTGPNTPALVERTSVRPKREIGSAALQVAQAKQLQKQEEIVDEEMVRTRKYWERWASHASKELLKTVYIDFENEKPEMEFVFSGRCGIEPKFKIQRDEDAMSEATNISLLSTSTLAHKDLKMTRKKKKTVTLANVKPNWEKLARERGNRGVLERLIRKDASQIERYMKGTHGPVQSTQASDLMEGYDKTLVKYTAFSKGLAGKDKSYSTENIMSFRPCRNNEPQSPTSKSASNQELQVRFRPQSMRRTPSPQIIKTELLSQDRPESAVILLPNEFQLEEKTRLIAPKSPLVRPHTSPYCPNYDLPVIPVSKLSHEKVNEQDMNGSFIRRVHRRMRATVNALDRATGFGDKTDTVNTVTGERGYTAADYGRVARYPQNIRIAPQLGKVIKAEIREKMGKPRRHAIRVTDIKQLDAENPKLGRSYRNMIIFNWLNEMELSDYDDRAPEIYDMEGKEPKKGKFTLYGDMSDMISNITTRPSTAFTSLYSGRVSDDEEDIEDGYDGLSVATGSACHLSSNGGSV